MSERIGHWCEFCQTTHSSMSCYHPGRQRITELKEELVCADGIKALDAKRITELEAEVERLRKAEGHVSGCLLRGKLVAGIAPMCTPCTCDRVYQKRLNRLLERLERICEQGGGTDEIMSDLLGAIKEARGDEQA